MATDIFEFTFDETKRVEWEGILQKTVSYAIEKWGFKPIDITSHGAKMKVSKGTGMDGLLKIAKKEGDASPEDYAMSIYGSFRAHALNDFYIDLYFSFYEKRGKSADRIPSDIAYLSVSSHDTMWLKADKKQRKAFNEFLMGIKRLLGLGIAEYETEREDAIKISSEGFVI